MLTALLPQWVLEFTFSSVANFLWTCTSKCKSFQQTHGLFCILIAWLTLGKSQALYLMIAMQMHSTAIASWTLCHAMHCKKEGVWMLQWRTFICRTRHLTLVLFIFLQLKITLGTIFLEYHSNKSVLYMLFYFLEAGGKGGVMHSPVAHVLYLCYPEMKHLCGDGFLRHNLIKF